MSNQASRKSKVMGRGAILLACGGLGICMQAQVGAKAEPAIPSDIMPVRQIKKGMQGYALTVFSGRTPEKFNVEIVDVIPGYLPKQDAVLFRAKDPRLEHSGIVAGMSGSPVYIEGKLVGAIAYGYRFGKDPLGGIAPIENMLEVAKLPHRPGVGVGQHMGPSAQGSMARGVGILESALGLSTSPLPTRARPQEVVHAQGGLMPLGVPLSVSGMSGGGAALISDALGMVPARSGSFAAVSSRDSAERASKGPYRFAPGDSVSVVLMHGDSSAAGNGTVTWVDPSGRSLLAFGHPMMGDGPTELPMGPAHVHSIVPNYERSIKLSSPLSIEGAMIQDRQAGIALRTDVQAPTISVITTIRGPESDIPRRVYHHQVALHPTLTPNLVSSALISGVEEASRDAAEVLLAVDHEIKVVTSQGPRTLVIREEMAFPSGVQTQALAQTRAAIVMSAALDNRFETVRVREIRQTATATYGVKAAEILDVQAPMRKVYAGESVTLLVRLRPFKGDEFVLPVALSIPEDVGGQSVVVELSGGRFATAYQPVAANVDDLLTALSAQYPARSLVVSLYRGEEGLATRKGLVEALPSSTLELLTPTNGLRELVRFKQAVRRVVEQDLVIYGGERVRIDVEPKRGFN